jgi:hypothetical protein
VVRLADALFVWRDSARQQRLASSAASPFTAGKGQTAPTLRDILTRNQYAVLSRCSRDLLHGFVFPVDGGT